MRRRIVSIRYCNAMYDTDATVQYSEAGTFVKRQEHLPLLPKLPDHFLGREVQVDLGGSEAVTAEEILPLRAGGDIIDLDERRLGRGKHRRMKADKR